MKDEIIIYQADEVSRHIEVRIDNETVWLSQLQIVELFESSKANISEHLKNIFQSNELDENSVVRNFRTTATDGKKYNIKYYNLDVIISVGYRVNSKRGIQFRIWANKVLKDYLLKGFIVAKRFERLENDVYKIKNQLEEIDIQIKTKLPSNEGVFYNGQIFDAYVFVSEIIKKAQSEIILIDNFIDETVLTLLTKRNPKVTVTIYTKHISKPLQLDLEKHNSQYPQIEIKPFADSHDRFLIIDQTELYHLGASLKDLGKKWFAFSKMDSLTNDLLKKLSDQ